SQSERADALIDEARRRAAEDAQAERGRAEGLVKKQSACELQNARLEARAVEANARWAELDAVLDEAVREVAVVRQRDPERYAAALERFLEAAREQLAAGRLTIRASGDDLRRLGAGCELVEAEVGAGIVVTTPDGNCVCDQTI